MSSWLKGIFAVLVLAPALGAQEVEDGIRVPADPPARWWKGNLHTHSFWSDGDDFPEMIADWYRRHGYHFLALSDHNILSRGERWMSIEAANNRAKKDAFGRYVERFGESWVETRTVDGATEVRLKPLNEFRALFEEPNRFLMIEGEEITDRFESKPVHLNASNLAELVPPQGGSSVVEVMRNNVNAVLEQEERTGQKMIVHLNHPNFGYGIKAEELAEVVEERFYEVYNGHPSVNHRGDDEHPSVEEIWDIANTIRLRSLKAPPLYGLGTDDSHNYHGHQGATPGRGWIMVRARHLTPESIIEAIEAGDFYASSGVTLADVKYDVDARALEVTVQPVDGATYRIEFVGTRGSSGPVGEVFTAVEGSSARYELQGDQLYVRAVVTSSLPPKNPVFEDQKRKAWTQPVGWASRVEHRGE